MSRNGEASEAEFKHDASSDSINTNKGPQNPRSSNLFKNKNNGNPASNVGLAPQDLPAVTRSCDEKEISELNDLIQLLKFKLDVEIAANEKDYQNLRAKWWSKHTNTHRLLFIYNPQEIKDCPEGWSIIFLNSKNQGAEVIVDFKDDLMKPLSNILPKCPEQETTSNGSKLKTDTAKLRKYWETHSDKFHEQFKSHKDYKFHEFFKEFKDFPLQLVAKKLERLSSLQKILTPHPNDKVLPLTRDTIQCIKYLLREMSQMKELKAKDKAIRLYLDNLCKAVESARTHGTEVELHQIINDTINDLRSCCHWPCSRGLKENFLRTLIWILQDAPKLKAISDLEGQVRILQETLQTQHRRIARLETRPDYDISPLALNRSTIHRRALTQIRAKPPKLLPDHVSVEPSNLEAKAQATKLLPQSSSSLSVWHQLGNQCQSATSREHEEQQPTRPLSSPSRLTKPESQSSALPNMVNS